MDSNKILKLNTEIYYKQKLLRLIEGREGTEYECATDKVDMENLKADIKQLQKEMHEE